MRILNIHQRQFEASAEAVGALIDSLASAADRLWPGRLWPRMRLDRPLGPGAAGGHGPIRYLVERYQAGKEIRFRFTAPRGFRGTHGYQVCCESDGRVILRHTLEMTTRGTALLSWPLLYGPLHDALLEDSLTLAAVMLGQHPDLRPWSRRVRLLRWLVSGGRAPAQSEAGFVPQSSGASPET